MSDKTVVSQLVRRWAQAASKRSGRGQAGRRTWFSELSMLAAEVTRRTATGTMMWKARRRASSCDAAGEGVVH